VDYYRVNIKFIFQAITTRSTSYFTVSKAAAARDIFLFKTPRLALGQTQLPIKEYGFFLS